MDNLPLRVGRDSSAASSYFRLPLDSAHSGASLRGVERGNRPMIITNRATSRTVYSDDDETVSDGYDGGEGWF